MRKPNFFYDFDIGLQIKYVQVGPEKYYFCEGYKRLGPKIYNMEIRSTDVFLVTVPKSGTTWTQELIWLLKNDFDYNSAKAVPITQRFPLLEQSMTHNSETARSHLNVDNGTEKQTQMTKILSMCGFEVLQKASSPRYIKTHLPLSLLPPELLGTAKVVYVARDPRDVAVSYYNHVRLMLTFGFQGDFKKFWHFFLNSLVSWTPYFSHVKEAWVMRNHPNVLFMFYEELCKDLPSSVRRVASFLDKPVTEEQVARLCDHLSFDNFKKNQAVNYENLRELGLLREGYSFMRKGKAGGWRDYFDEELSAQAQRWIDDNLRGTDLRFPDL
ncbi:hypothetical protein ABMA28_014449 [Loxostege sticticalis]|uniref:Sulfotransferase domain-containing protein n=1 Tax=Loxostege sticticalis TaxID=481309 RepID=A0ABD0TGZ0_LOXSC